MARRYRCWCNQRSGTRSSGAYVFSRQSGIQKRKGVMAAAKSSQVMISAASSTGRCNTI